MFPENYSNFLSFVNDLLSLHIGLVTLWEKLNLITKKTSQVCGQRWSSQLDQYVIMRCLFRAASQCGAMVEWRSASDKWSHTQYGIYHFFSIKLRKLDISRTQYYEMWCNIVYSGRNRTMFRRNTLPPSSGSTLCRTMMKNQVETYKSKLFFLLTARVEHLRRWRWVQYVPPKHR